MSAPFADAFSVSAAARAVPDRPALIVDGGAVTYAELAARTAAASTWLRRRHGDGPRRHAYVAERRVESLTVAYAAFELGWTLVPLHARSSEPERRAVVEGLGLDGWDGPGEVPGTSGPEVPGSSLEASLGEVPGTSTEVPGTSGPEVPGTSLGSSLEASLGEVPGTSPDRDPEALLAIVPTSGSTGTPKGVALSYRAFFDAARASARRIGWGDDARWLLSLPLAHVGGLSILTRCLIDRRTAVLPPTGERFDPESVLARIRADAVTHLSVVPQMLRRLLDASDGPPPSLRRVLVGGAPLPPAWLDDARRAGWPALATYGLTEACSQVATQPPSDLGTSPTAQGAPLLDGVEARLDGEGVLSLRGPTLFSGYLPRGATRGVDGGGWLRTGDVARLEGDRLHILGRHDHMILTGGENVHPAEVERALLQLPGVGEACVVGVADARWGQTVAAAVAPAGEGASIEAGALDEALRGRLAGFKLPRRWRTLQALPRTPSGKVDRRAVKRLFDGAPSPAATPHHSP